MKGDKLIQPPKKCPYLRLLGLRGNIEREGFHYLSRKITLSALQVSANDLVFI